jgi:hypothetical protein
MNLKRSLLIVAILVLMAVALIVTHSAVTMAKDASTEPMRGKLPRYSLAGAWIAEVPLPPPYPESVVHLITLDPQDPTGNRYTLVVKHSQCSPYAFGAFPEGGIQSDSVGLLVRTGRDTYRFTIVGHVTNETDPTLPPWFGVDEMSHISVISGTMSPIDCDTLETEAMIAYYAAVQDSDGDGFPDEGQIPVLCVPIAATARRMQLMPPCEPTPMP